MTATAKRGLPVEDPNAPLTAGDGSPSGVLLVAAVVLVLLTLPRRPIPGHDARPNDDKHRQTNGIKLVRAALQVSEEMIAAAHSACFAMQLSAVIAEMGATPQSLGVTAAVSFGPDTPGFRLTGISSPSADSSTLNPSSGCPGREGELPSQQSIGMCAHQPGGRIGVMS